MTLRTLLAAAALFAAACAPTQTAEPPAPTPPPMSDSCPAADWSYLVGQPESAIPRDRLPARARVICHNCPVTMDYAPGRLNIELDAAGNVSRVRCG